MNRLLEKLSADYRDGLANYDEILNRCTAEGRDPDPGEARILDELRSEMEPLGERIVQLRSDADRRASTLTAMTPDSADGRNAPAPLQPGSAPPLQTRARRHPLPSLEVGEVQLRAVMDAIETRTPYSQPVELQTRAAITTPGGVGSVPFWSYPPIPTGVEGRLADRIATRAADAGNTVSYLAVTAPAVLQAVAEAAAKPDSTLVVGRRTATLTKMAAYSDLSWEVQADFDSVMSLVNLELQSGLIRAENASIVAAILGDAGILAPAVTGTSGLLQLLQIKAAVRAAPNVGQPDLVIIHPLDFAALASELAATSGMLLGGTEAVQVGPAETLWGMEVAQTVGITKGTALVGVSDAACFFLREGPVLFVDPYTQSTNNLTRIILEERYASGLLNPGRWAKWTVVATGV
ncbi:MAG TPA: phage major capsid protein, partial [Acidimicrobiales bacterium]|nr:phage major capsid protein [Acidimicrobiales bacterium]